MNENLASRRRFIVSALTFSTLATIVPGHTWLRSSAAWAGSPESSGHGTMAKLARLLFPHDEIPDSVYAGVIGYVFTTFANDPANAKLIKEAELALDGSGNTPWFDRNEDEQITAITAMQDAAFFAAILATIRGAFYYNPAVWKYLNYPGSSKQYGGYKNRGFDDISWLPGDA
jgi:hypothetical protein